MINRFWDILRLGLPFRSRPRHYSTLYIWKKGKPSQWTKINVGILQPWHLPPLFFSLPPLVGKFQPFFFQLWWLALARLYHNLNIICFRSVSNVRSHCVSPCISCCIWKFALKWIKEKDKVNVSYSLHFTFYQKIPEKSPTNAA